MTCGGSDRVCARCRQRPTQHRQTGCLCQPCEDAIEGMTQEQLDADYRAHAGVPTGWAETSDD